MALLEQARSQAFYFRRGGRSLFGSYHFPRGHAVRAAAVVLCQPLASEYLRCHRAFRVLADQLARAGFAVLRFDYFASGDSAGESSEGDLEQWVLDVSAAVTECRARAGTQRVAAVGLRLGASLASICTHRAGALDALVLWEPVVSGRRYLEDLAHQEYEFQRSLPNGKRESAAPPDGAELLGFSYSPTLLQQLGALDLQAASPRARRMLVVGANGIEPGFPAHAEYLTIATPKIWLEDADRALVPKASLDKMVSWLSEVYA